LDLAVAGLVASGFKAVRTVSVILGEENFSLTTALVFKFQPFLVACEHVLEKVVRIKCKEGEKVLFSFFLFCFFRDLFNFFNRRAFGNPLGNDSQLRNRGVCSACVGEAALPTFPNANALSLDAGKAALWARVLAFQFSEDTDIALSDSSTVA
jgi:hypothetical protein